MKHPKHYDTDAVTSKRMSSVKLKRGRVETMLAKELWHRGYRYRLNYNKLPGSPDIALKKYNIAIFIDGEFWHGKDWDIRKESLKRNKEYWKEKIEENIARDNRIDIELRQLGWIALHYWSKQVLDSVEYCADEIEGIIAEIIKEKTNQYLNNDIFEEISN